MQPLTDEGRKLAEYDDLDMGMDLALDLDLDFDFLLGPVSNQLLPPAPAREEMRLVPLMDDIDMMRQVEEPMRARAVDEEDADELQTIVKAAVAKRDGMTAKVMDKFYKDVVNVLIS